MDPAFKLVLGLFAVPIAFALAWHVVIKNFVVASILSGISAAITYGLMAEELTEFSFVWDFATQVIPATLISLAIGIPFNRRRNPPLPAGTTASSPGISWNQRLTWRQIVPALLGIVLFVILEVWWW